MTRMSSVREREPACPAVGKVTTRSAVAADSSFLLELYASAWQGELDPIGWSISGQRTFVIMQAQTREWRLIRRFQQLSRLTVCVDDEPVGRMLVSCTDAVIDLVDMCLLPAWRGRGIGTRLLKDLLDETAALHIPVRVKVPKNSRVAASCAGLGFADPLDCGTDWMLTWTPPEPDPATHPRGGHRATTGVGG